MARAVDDDGAVPDVRVSFFGDSLVAGVGDPAGAGWVGRLVAGAFAAGMPVTPYNLGVRRETSSDVLARWVSELAPRRAEHADCRVVFSFGANDTTWEDGRPRCPPAASVDNLERALAGARERRLPTFVVGPPPVNDDAQRQRIRALSAAFAGAAARRQVPYVDIADRLCASPRYRHELEAGDRAHPGAAGHAQIAELVMPAWLDWLAAPLPRGGD